MADLEVFLEVYITVYLRRWQMLWFEYVKVPRWNPIGKVVIKGTSREADPSSYVVVLNILFSTLLGEDSHFD